MASDAIACVIVASGAPVRVTFDGTEPTATYGLPIGVDRPVTLPMAADIRAICAETSASARLDVMWLAGGTPYMAQRRASTSSSRNPAG